MATDAKGRFTDGPRSASARAVCKPSSVPIDAEASTGDGHPSEAVGRPTAHAADPRAGQRASPPAGRPARVAPSYLALLRVEFARFTPPPTRKPGVGIVTVALVLVSRRTGITRHPALWSSDFPHGTSRVTPTGAARPSDRLADVLIPTLAERTGGRRHGIRQGRVAELDGRAPCGIALLDEARRRARTTCARADPARAAVKSSVTSTSW